MTAPTASLWAATAPAGPVLARLGADASAQVTVIGAGYTGLSAALHLAAAGRDVVVLEAREIGEGASGLNGGQVIPGVKHDPDALEEMFGPVVGSRLVDTVGSGPDMVFDLISQHDIDCHAARAGWIQPATSPAALQMVRARASQWRRRGADVQILSAAETARLIGSERYCGGWLDRRGGSVQPLAYVRGLARAASSSGARIFVRTPVIGLERAGGSWRVRTEAATVDSGIVILATDAYTGPLVDALRRTLIAVPSLQVATEPLSPSQRLGILPEGQSVSDTWHLLRYFRVDATGRLVMGSRGAFGNVSPSAAARLHQRAVREIYPQLAGVRYEYQWGGLVAMTRDHLPHLHEVAPGLLAGLGYNGRGVAMATVMGSVLADWVNGTPADQLRFPVTSLAPFALHRFSQLGARVAVQGLRAMDSLVRVRDRLLAGVGLQ